MRASKPVSVNHLSGHITFDLQSVVNLGLFSLAKKREGNQGRCVLYNTSESFGASPCIISLCTYHTDSVIVYCSVVGAQSGVVLSSLLPGRLGSLCFCTSESVGATIL